MGLPDAPLADDPVRDTAVEVADIPANLVEPAEIGAGGAAVHTRPTDRSHVVAKIGAGAFILVTGVTAAGFYKIQWGKIAGFIKKAALKAIPKSLK